MCSRDTACGDSGGRALSVEELLAQLDREAAEEEPAGPGSEPEVEDVEDVEPEVEDVEPEVEDVLAADPGFVDEYEAEDRRRADMEARAFDERCRRADEEARVRAAAERQRRSEAIQEARERECMAREEAGERQRRAEVRSRQQEVETLERARKEGARRQRDRELARVAAREERRRARELRNREREERGRERRQGRVAWMCESGFAWAPQGGWTYVGPGDRPAMPRDLLSDDDDKLSGPSDEEAGDDGGGAHRGGDDAAHGGEDEIIDQRPRKEDLEHAEIVPLDDLLAEIDGREKEDWEAQGEVPQLDAMLAVISADAERDAAVEVKQSFAEMGHVEEPGDRGEEHAVLRAANEKKPDTDWKGLVGREGTLAPSNDFVEEKQEGWNSFEERQARSAAIQAKLQAARNRMSVVRYSSRVAAEAAAAQSMGSWGAYQQGSLERAAEEARGHRETRRRQPVQGQGGPRAARPALPPRQRPPPATSARPSQQAEDVD